MKGSRSDRTDHDVLKQILRLSLTGLLVLVLGSCALNEPKEAPPEPPPQHNLPCSTLPAKDLERQALEMLDAGNTLQARETLNCALDLSPGSNQATLLLEQLDADPVKYLGARHFWYQVKSSDTLSKIAGKYLGSNLKFVILARYNDIDVPASLFSGQKIKIPGSKPAESAQQKESVIEEKPAVAEDTQPPTFEASTLSAAEDLRDEALLLEGKGMLDKAYALMIQAVSEDAMLENGQSDLERIKKSYILQLEENAYNQELSGDKTKAIGIWQKILDIDPGNIPAQLARKRLAQ